MKVFVTFCISAIIALTVVSAYVFTTGGITMLQGTTYQMAVDPFRDYHGEVQVYLSGTWYEVCNDDYTLNGDTITMLRDVSCNALATSGPLCAGGGCGS